MAVSEAFQDRECRRTCPHFLVIEYQARSVTLCSHRRDTALVQKTRERRGITPQPMESLQECPDEARRERGKASA